MIIANKDKSQYINSDNVLNFHVYNSSQTNKYKLTVYVIGKETSIELNSFETFEEANKCIRDISHRIANNTSYFEIV